MHRAEDHPEGATDRKLEDTTRVPTPNTLIRGVVVVVVVASGRQRHQAGSGGTGSLSKVNPCTAGCNLGGKLVYHSSMFLTTVRPVAIAVSFWKNCGSSGYTPLYVPSDAPHGIACRSIRKLTFDRCPCSSNVVKKEPGTLVVQATVVRRPRIVHRTHVSTSVLYGDGRKQARARSTWTTPRCV